MLMMQNLSGIRWYKNSDIILLFSLLFSNERQREWKCDESNMKTDIIRGTFSSWEKKNEFQLEFDFAAARWQKNSKNYNNKPGETINGAHFTFGT